ncbi:hypothetical protein [Sphingomonas cavernae]|uniref:hypothetical protein n=1 Tax=Sphingomonas cavernae TaxID=2320861 RepID=UPI0011C44763|nr:hypothetical protein [Sphingomonas cavernae]
MADQKRPMMTARAGPAMTVPTTGTPDFIGGRQIALFGQLHSDYGAAVRKIWEQAKTTLNSAISAPEDERTTALAN